MGNLNGRVIYFLLNIFDISYISASVSVSLNLYLHLSIYPPTYLRLLTYIYISIYLSPFGLLVLLVVVLCDVGVCKREILSNGNRQLLCALIN